MHPSRHLGYQNRRRHGPRGNLGIKDPSEGNPSYQAPRWKWVTCSNSGSSHQQDQQQHGENAVQCRGVGVFDGSAVATLNMQRSQREPGCQRSPRMETELRNPQRNLGYPFPYGQREHWRRSAIIAVAPATITLESTNSTTSSSPVVLVAGPGPEGKPVIKPPEGTWIIVNPQLAGLLWVKQDFQLSTMKAEKLSKILSKMNEHECRGW